MKIRCANDVPPKPVEMPGAEKATIRLLIHEDEGAPTFYMRQFDLAPGGQTPYHEHAWEHEIYILTGSGAVVSDVGPTDVSAGDCVFIPGGQMHRLRNTGDETFTFLCLVPKGC